MINKLLQILFLIISYLILKDILVQKQIDIYKKKNELKVTPKEKISKNILKKFNFLSSKDKFLSKQGYPLNLNVITYYVVKIILASIFFTSAVLNYDSKLILIIFPILGYFLIDIYILINKKNRENAICEDLLNVTNSISLQLSANISLKNSLKKQFAICKNKDFKKAMLEFSTNYELSELSIEKSLKILQDKFDITEITMFCNALEEYNKVGDITEVLENLTEILKTKYIEKLKETTRKKIIYMTLGVIIALCNIVLIIFYPLFISISQGFSTIFS